MTYLLLCSEHAYNLLVSEGTLATASGPERVPALVSSSLGGPWGHLARSPGHQGHPVLDEPLSYRRWIGSLQTGDMHMNERKQTRLRIKWGDPREESNGCTLLRGQQHASSARLRSGRCWQAICCLEAWLWGSRDRALLSAFCQAPWEPAYPPGQLERHLENPTPRICNIC